MDAKQMIFVTIKASDGSFVNSNILNEAASEYYTQINEMVIDS